MNRRQLIRAVKSASRKIQDEEWPIGSLKEREMIELWRRIRPQMTARLESMGILEEFAHLLHCRRMEAEDQYLKAGMGWPDSREQANLDWLIVEPESDPDVTPNAEPMDEEQLLSRLVNVDEAPSMWSRVPRRVRRSKSQSMSPS